MSEGVRLREMLRCAERELALRRWVYPKQIARQNMDENTANREIRLMQDIVNYLRRDLEAP
jgi:hypothetical protein